MLRPEWRALGAAQARSAGRHEVVALLAHPCARSSDTLEAGGGWNSSSPPGWGRGLEEDLGGDLGLAASPDELDRGVEIRLTVRQPLGERERIARLHQHVEPPALDLRALALFVFGDLCHRRSCR